MVGAGRGWSRRLWRSGSSTAPSPPSNPLGKESLNGSSPPLPTPNAGELSGNSSLLQPSPFPPRHAPHPCTLNKGARRLHCPNPLTVPPPSNWGFIPPQPHHPPLTVPPPNTPPQKGAQRLHRPRRRAAGHPPPAAPQARGRRAERGEAPAARQVHMGGRWGWGAWFWFGVGVWGVLGGLVGLGVEGGEAPAARLVHLGRRSWRGGVGGYWVEGVGSGLLRLVSLAPSIPDPGP